MAPSKSKKAAKKTTKKSTRKPAAKKAAGRKPASDVVDKDDYNTTGEGGSGYPDEHKNDEGHTPPQPSEVGKSKSAEPETDMVMLRYNITLSMLSRADISTTPSSVVSLIEPLVQYIATGSVPAARVEPPA